MTPDEFMANYESALAGQQRANIEPLVHPEAIVQFSDGTYVGREDVLDAMQRTFDLIQDEDYNITQLHWVEQTPQFACCIYHFHWSGMIDGKLASGSGRGTSVLVNENGTWQLKVEHLGPNP